MTTLKLKDKGIKFIQLTTVSIILITILWAFTSTNVSQEFYTGTNAIWEDGWTQLLNNEEIALDSISEFETVENNEVLTLTNEIPILTNDVVLFFYSKDLEINVYIGDEEMYSLQIPENFSFIDSPGHLWIQVPISTEYSGETIRIELTSQFSNRFMGTVTKLYLINECETLDVLLMNEGFRYIMSAFIAFMTIYAYINSFIWKRDTIKNYFMTLGNFYLSITLWLWSMCGIFNYIFDNPLGNMMICNLMVLVIPINIFRFFKVINTRPNIWMEILGVLMYINFYLQIALLIICKISLLDLLPLSFVFYTIGTIGVMILVFQYIYKYFKIKKTMPHIRCSEADFAMISTLIFFAAALVEIFILCFFPNRTDLIGVSGIIGASLYMIINLVALEHYNSKTDIQKLNLENDYNQLQNVTLVQEIKAHFFYNTLNTISALCKTDSDAANNAIISFAKYMHSYMHLISTKHNIPLIDEISLLESSLELEHMRHPDTFNYHIDLECEEVLIPPLSIQPLVENALYHGLRPSDRFGELTISSRKFMKHVEITISDNGVGFDTKIINEEKSIALTNLIKRIEIMAKGRVIINSEINRGTTVIIEIPYK